MFCDSREHPGTNLFSIMKCKYKIRPTFTKKGLMGATLPFQLPAYGNQSRKNSLRP